MTGPGGVITVTLTRGTGKGQWQAHRSSDTGPHLLFFRCPFCAAMGTMAGVPIRADGLSTMAVSCSSEACGFTYVPFLRGWADLGQPSPPRPRPMNLVDHPGAFSMCQADGYSDEAGE